MPDIRPKILILLCGALIVTSTTLCHAQEPGTLLDVKTVRAEASPIFVPEITNTPAVRPAEVKPARIVSENSWYWRILQGILLNAAEYNTVKQSDGRPGPHGNFR
ncbi:MAG: hypothetical protein V1791_02500 [Pseudomonadota bacterium]